MRRSAAIGVALLLLAAPTATALPGDAPIVPLSPPDGTTLTVDPSGIAVTFSCPVYGMFLSGDFAFPGGPKDYGVSFSVSSAVGADGRLVDPIALPQATSAGGDTCSASMNPGGPPPRPQETPGTYYWQAWRLCSGCPTGYETGPLRSFTLRANAKLRIGSLGKVYAGYGVIVPVSATGVSDGARVTLQRRVGSGWRTVASAFTLDERAQPVAKLSRGAQRLRAILSVGNQPVTSPERRVTVLRAGSWSTAGDGGAYAGSAGERSVRFAVTTDGRTLTGFTAFVPMLCPGVTAGQFTTQIGTAKLARVAIAPDGRFVGAAVRRGSSISVQGKLAGGRVRKGRVTLSVGPCSGNSSFAAKRR